MTERTRGFKVMAIRTTQVTGAVEFSLVFIEPRLPGWMGVAVMAIFRRVAKSPIDIVALVADVILQGQRCKVMGCISVLPGCSRWNLGPGRAEVALDAVSIQIMTGAAIKRASAMEFCLVFVEPGLAQIVNVAVVAACRSISKRSVQIMTFATGFVFRGQIWIIVRRLAMVPDYAGRHLAAVGAKMTLDAVSVQIMTGTTFKSAGTVKICLFFVKP